jgi:hypothetical protein
MIPSVVDALRFRWMMTAWVRLISLVLVLLAVVPFISWGYEGWLDNDFFDLYYYAGRIALIVVLGLAGIGGIAFAGPLVRFVTPIPARHACPSCGYSMSGVRPTRCPECGLDVSSFDAAWSRAQDGRAWQERAVLRVIVVLRMIAVLVGLVASGLLLWELSAWQGNMQRWALDRVVEPLSVVLASAGLILISRWLAERIVPPAGPGHEAKLPPLPSQSASGGDNGGDHGSGNPNDGRSTG